MKKLIIITSPLYIRNYIDTDAFNKIKDKNTFIACTSNISNKQSVLSDESFVGEFESSSINKAIFTFFSLLIMYSKRRVGKGLYVYFKIRHTTIFYPSLRLKKKVDQWFSNKLIKYIVIRILEFSRLFFHPVSFLKLFLIVLIDFLGLTKKLVKAYNLLLHNNIELKSIIEKVNPDLILIPNGGQDSNLHEVLALSAQNSFKTIVLIDNWDNLCSKAVFPVEPDYLGVWGKQAESHAIKMHNFEPSRVFLAGTPRFDGYQVYKQNEASLKEKYQKLLNFPYILFAGCWPPFDEIGVLEDLNELVEKYKNFLPKNCKILYRPHPWGENYDKLDNLTAKNLKNIAIDPQMAQKSRPDDWTKRTDFQPNLDYYPLLLDKAEFVICPLATIIIEASLMGKKVLALAHDDGKNFLNPSFMYKNSDYFDRLSDLNSVLFLDDLTDLDKLFKQMITSDMLVDRKALSYYIVDDGLLYKERIANICNKLNLK